MADGSKREIFLDHLEPSLRSSYESMSDLESRLGGALDKAHGAWPNLAIEAPAFLGYLAERAPPDVTAESALDHLHAADLYLALACSRGDRAALDGFARTFGSDIDAAVRRFEGPTLRADDLKQVLHEKLFVGKSGVRPKIADYSGQGFLQNWIRVTAVRAFTDLARASVRPGAHVGEDELLALADSDDLELSFLKKHYRAGFKRAFEHAVTELEARDRNLLRQSVVHGLGIDQVAALYGIHRATAARRIEKARDALLTATRKSLMQSLAIDRAEFDSVMDLIKSRLDVSIHRVLGSKSEG